MLTNDVKQEYQSTTGIYDKIILVGFGKIAFDILKEMIYVQPQWGYELIVMEYELYPTSLLGKLCRENGLAFYRFHGDKQAITKKLLEYQDSVLIISAGNKFLFPKEIVSKPNINIINFHGALLPKYPGRNAPSWAIYEGEKSSGATWHWVNTGVDTGRIIWQGECLIGEDTKGYELSRCIMQLAYEGFLEIFEEVLCGGAQGWPQPVDEGKRKVYYSYEIPSNGRFSLKEKPENIYRLLRSVDYGLNPIFPKMQTDLPNGRTVEILGYKKVRRTEGRGTEADGCAVLANQILLPYDTQYDLVLKF